MSNTKGTQQACACVCMYVCVYMHVHNNKEVVNVRERRGMRRTVGGKGGMEVT